MTVIFVQSILIYFRRHCAKVWGDPRRKTWFWLKLSKILQKNFCCPFFPSSKAIFFLVKMRFQSVLWELTKSIRSNRKNFFKQMPSREFLESNRLNWYLVKVLEQKILDYDTLLWKRKKNFVTELIAIIRVNYVLCSFCRSNSLLKSLPPQANFEVMTRNDFDKSRP